MSFLLGFFLEATIGMIGFWFLEVSSLLFVYMLFSFFLSGHMFPLDMLAGAAIGRRSCDSRCRCNTWPTFRRPCFLGKIQGAELWLGLAIEAGLGRVFHRRLPRGVPPRRAALQRVRRVEQNDRSDARRRRSCDLPSPIHPSYLACFSRSRATAWCAT